MGFMLMLVGRVDRKLLLEYSFPRLRLVRHYPKLL